MKSLNTLLAALLLMSAGHSGAASDVDLAVKGKITPSACEPSLSNDGNVDYGKIAAKSLNPDTSTLLPFHSFQLTVTCEAETLLALQTKDNREGTSYSDSHHSYGLGLINGNEKLGALSLSMTAAIADGITSQVISSPNGISWFEEHYFSSKTILSVSKTHNLAPTPVKLLTSFFNIFPSIAPAKDLTLNAEVPIDGSVTLTVQYL